MPPSYLGAIRHVLNTYPFSKGLFREILQNSADAGATTQIFVVDHRNYSELSIDQSKLTAIRGPALLAYNDSVFTDQDFESLFKLWDSSKKHDASKIGKFGMGFRSTFHVTDTPQVLSRSTLAILDPLQRISQNEEVKIDVTQDPQGAELAKAFALDFFRPGRNAEEEFPGSVVRLPLRTAPSGISHETLTAADLGKLLLEFAEDEVQIALLFLKNLTSIKIYEIDAAGARTCHITCSVRKSKTDPLLATSPDTAVSCMDVTVTSTAHWLPEPFEIKHWRILQTSFSHEKAALTLSRRVGSNAADNLIENKLHAALAIAVPLSVLDEKTMCSTFGRLFTYLPLPLMTGFCVHIHGLFALTPSREKLQNREEIPAHGSDYHISVEWNKLLFEEYLPQAWMYLLRMLKDKGIEDIFMAWPPAQTANQLGDSGYWEQLPLKLLECVIDSESPIWPVVSSQAGAAKRYLALEDVLVAAADEDINLLQTLATFGLQITRPPKYIAQLITSKAVAKILSPVTAYEILREHPESLLLAANADKISSVTLYLLSTGIINHLVDLPVIPIANNRRVALRPRHEASTIHTLLEAEELKVFGARDENAVPLSRFDPAIAALLRRQGPDVLNVQALSPVVVIGYLETYPKAPGLVPGTGKLDASIVSWISQFWNWMKKSTLSGQLYPMLTNLPLLPAQDGLKPINSHIFDQTGLHPNLISSLKKLRISFLHQDVVPHRKALSTFKKFSDVFDLRDFLDALTMENIEAFSADEGVAAHLVKHITGCSARTELSEDQRIKLRHLPIYPLAVAPQSRSSRPRVRISDGQKIIGVVLENLSTLPMVQGITFLDGSEVNFALIRIFDPDISPYYFSDADLLRLALDHFTTQSAVSQHSFVEFVAQYRSKLPGELLDRLGKIPFVMSTNGTKRCPNDLVDPKSPLSPLFSNASDCFPRMQDPDEIKLVDNLRSINLMETALSTEIVKERIRFISNNNNRDVAHALLRLIYSTRFKLTRMPEIYLKWLPTPKGLLTPDQCRDAPHQRELFDCVLSPLDKDVKTDAPFREMFGWDQPLAVSVLIKQLSYMLVQPSKSAYDTVYLIVKELVARRLSVDDIASLRKAISGRPWVPVSEGGGQLAIAEHVVFSGGNPSVGFFQIPFASAAAAVQFFKAMGCTNRPSTDAILGKLELLRKEAPSASVAEQALHLLRLLPANVSDEEKSRVLVPDTNFVLRSLSSIFYNDIGFIPPGDDCQVAYLKVDDDLANSLRMDRLGLKSSYIEQFAIDMEVELTTVIRNKLQSYTPQQFLPEFLANAADAGATEFGVLVDEAPGSSGRILTDKMLTFQKCPSVIVYNNAVFSDSDFKGICRTGIGGKVARSDSIGQFGSGALTMFHLTDLAMIVSGDRVLFINPSKRDLPFVGPALRVTLPMSLERMKQRYPDHLASLDGVFGFELASATPYNGTLFRLPLRMAAPSADDPILAATWTVPQVLKDIIQPFEDSSELFMLFSQIREVKVQYRKSHELHCRWRSTATQRDERTTDENRSKIIDVELYCEARPRIKSQTWHIVSTSLSSQDILSDSLADKYRLRLPIVLGLAAQVAGSKAKAGYKLFSTLPLPGSSSLPVHLTAPFILSDDRRHIRLDDYDPTACKYNKWLLSTAIPPLYMFLLADLLQTRDNNSSWWPGDTDDEDQITGVLTASFYSRHLKDTNQRVFQRAYCTSSHDSLLPKDALLTDPHLQRTMDKVFRLLAPSLVFLPERIALRALKEAKVTRLTPEILKNLIIQFPSSAPLHLKSKHLHRLHDFLSEGGRRENLIDLCLLPVADGTFVAFGEKTTDPSRTYFVADRQVHDLFPRNGRLVQPEFPVVGLLSLKINIVRLNGPALAVLLSERLVEVNAMEVDEDTEMWIASFWEEYPHLRVKWGDIAAFPLVPTTMPGCYTSINNCKSQSAVILSNDAEDKRIWESLTSLGLTVVERYTRNFPRALKQILSKEEEFPDFAFHHILQAMTSLQPTISDRFDQLRSELRTLLSEWCQKEIASGIPGDLIAFARTLPIWPAVSSHSSALRPAEELTMLPAGVALNIAGRFTNFPLTQYSDALVELHVTAPTIPDFLGVLALELPPVLPAGDTAAYKVLLEIFISGIHSYSSDALRVPNCNRVLVHPRDLYARDRLFLDAFQGTPGLFLLEDFADLEDRLVAFGLKQGLNFEIFKECARAIHTSGPPNAELVRRAGTVYEAYCEELPLHISAHNQGLWLELDNFRFIPRDPSRHRSLTSVSAVNPLVYANDLPAIVSPAELVLPAFECIVWTQRSIFLEQPDERILIAYPAFGKPTFPEVVEHLVILARALGDHPSNPHILHDLRETYQWLDENCDSPEASHSLLQHHSKPLFLNVVHPSGDSERQWHSAAQLLLEEPRGFGNYHPVHAFLSPFTKLLRASGVKVVSQPDPPENRDIPPDPAASLRDHFLEMRRAKKLTDVEFHAGDNEVEILSGHRIFLAAYSTFLYDAFTNDMEPSNHSTSVSDPKIISVKEYTSRCVAAALDFVYSGRLPDIDGEDCLELLLEVTKLSGYWQMIKLHDEVQRHIIRTRLITGETCLNIQEIAEEWQAELLVRACQEYREKNRSLIWSMR